MSREKSSAGKKGSAKKDRPDKHRLQILEAAAELFLERGYAGVTMNEVADRADKAKATIYYYFQDKEELILEIFKQSSNLVSKHFEPIVQSSLHPAEKLRRIIYEYTMLMCSNIFFETTSIRGPMDLPEPSKSSVLKLFRKEELLFEKLIKEGQEKNIFKDIPPRILIEAFLGMCCNISKWYKYTNFKAEEIASKFILIFEYGCLNSDSNSLQDVFPRPESTDAVFEEITLHVKVLEDNLSELNEKLKKANASLSEGLAK